MREDHTMNANRIRVGLRHFSGYAGCAAMLVCAACVLACAPAADAQGVAQLPFV